MTASPAPVAICYVRVSTDEQATHGVSLASQDAAVRAYCALRGFSVARVIVDAGVSAGIPLAERPGGAELLAALRGRTAAAPRHVVCVKLDRAFRSVVDCLQVTQEWERRGVALHLTDLGGQAVDTSSAMGRFMLTVLAGAAELERNMIGERTSAALQHKRTRGEYTGGRVPYGFTLDAAGALQPCPEERAIIDAARTLRASGLSLRAISAALAERGMLSRTGNPFHVEVMQHMVAA